jgi:hypothetical protein
LKIAIIGTRGIPNNHGGFEQFAEYFSVFLANKGHEVYVYNSHNHPYSMADYKGVKIIHCFDPEFKLGTVGQFIYDLNCIMDSRKRKFQIILQLGYTSSTIWHWLMPSKPVIVTNMDGLEWKRTKYKTYVRKFLKYAEKLGAKYSDYLISDSIGIQEYIAKEYNKESHFIAYGANVFDHPNPEVLQRYNVIESEYSIIIARLEPENNIEIILDGYHESNTNKPILVFGGQNKFGEYLKNKFRQDVRIKFVGVNYKIDELNNLRHFSRYYFHGHSVGGTNPSLLEAMASRGLVIANNNIFNKSILGDNAKYFDNSLDVKLILDEDQYFNFNEIYCNNNVDEINNKYNWKKINSQYEEYLMSLLK